MARALRRSRSQRRRVNKRSKSQRRRSQVKSRSLRGSQRSQRRRVNRSQRRVNRSQRRVNRSQRRRVKRKRTRITRKNIRRLGGAREKVRDLIKKSFTSKLDEEIEKVIIGTIMGGKPFSTNEEIRAEALIMDKPRFVGLLAMYSTHPNVLVTYDQLVKEYKKPLPSGGLIAQGKTDNEIFKGIRETVIDELFSPEEAKMSFY